MVGVTARLRSGRTMCMESPRVLLERDPAGIALVFLVLNFFDNLLELVLTSA